MSFDPVFLPPEQAIERSVSMTFLKHRDLCPRSAFLYRKYRGVERQSVKMLRGSVFHTILERCTNAMIDEGEERIPPEVAKAVVGEVLQEAALPIDEHDYVREAVYRWAGEWRLRPEERIVAVERPFVLELEGWEIRCKIDFATADAGNRLYVADYKSGRGAPPYDEISRKRPDGTLAGKAFQLILYVLAIAFGVAQQTCPTCMKRVEGELLSDSFSWRATAMARQDCPTCGGRGMIDAPAVRAVPEAIAEFVYPGIEDGDGKMLRREVTFTRLEMLEYRESLIGQLRQLSEQIESGDWPAVVSDAACSICPASSECPIPEQLRDHAGAINTDADAVAALTRRHVVSMQNRGLGRELGLYLRKTRGGRPLRYGKRVAEIVPRETVEIKDKDGLIEALAGGMDAGEAREKFVKISKGTSFAERDLTAAELEGEVGDGGHADGTHGSETD